MRKLLFLFALLLLAGMALTGCQKPPTAEVADAQQAVSSTAKAGAQEYAPAELAGAEAALAAANAEVEAQNQRFALSRDYDEAKKLLVQAIEKAEAAAEAAASAKAQAEADAEAALDGLTTTLEQATADLQALVDCSRKPKGFAADLEALTGRLEALEAEVGPIEEAIAEQAYRDAVASAETLSASLSALSADFGSAREKLGC